MRRLIVAAAVSLLWGSAAFAQGAVSISVPNAGTTGTTLNKLAKLTGSPTSTAVITATTDFAGISGVVVSNAGTTGNALIAVSGIASCIFDANGAAANATVINSPITVGACADGTATGSTAYEPVGVALAAVSGGATGQISVTHRKTPKSIVTAPTSFTATGAIDMTTTGTASLCNLPATYNSSSAGTLTIGSGASPGCITTVTALGTGLATIAVTGGSFVSNTACAATPRTKGQGSTIGIQIISNAGSAPVVSVSGDCG